MRGNMNILLETTRLVLREWEKSDYEALLAIANQPYVHGWLPDWYGWDRWGHDWIDKVNKHYQIDNPTTNFISWAIVFKETNTVIGQISIGNFENKEIGIGYFIDENYCNHGYTTEAAGDLIQHVFRKYCYDHIIATVQPLNHSSNAVIMKLSFQFVSTIEILDDGQVEVLPFNYYRLNNPYIKE
jgi:ribosomal-protein-alanine N-acetyltransferase